MRAALLAVLTILAVGSCVTGSTPAASPEGSVATVSPAASEPPTSPASSTAPSIAPSASALPTTVPDVSVAPLPAGGISEEQARSLASQHAGNLQFDWARADLYGHVNPESSPAPGASVKPDRLVWAVGFKGQGIVCSPGGICRTPGPCATTVYLDYFTGEFLEVSGLCTPPLNTRNP